MERKCIPMEELMPILQLQMDQGGQAFLTVTGVSMLPMLTHLRDRVVLTPCDHALRRGDVILFRRDNGMYVLHRIVKLSHPMVCCGDNQWQGEQVYPEQVVAVVSAFERCGKLHAVSAWTYRVYTALMVVLFPVRRPYIAVRRWLGRLYRSLSKK